MRRRRGRGGGCRTYATVADSALAWAADESTHAREGAARHEDVFRQQPPPMKAVTAVATEAAAAFLASTGAAAALATIPASAAHVAAADACAVRERRR